MKIQHVDNYHAERRAAGSNMAIMAFRDDDTGEIITSGYVVTGYRGKDSHKLLPTRADAELFMSTIKNGHD